MKKYNISFKQPELDLNGHVFKLLKSTVDIQTEAIKLTKEIEKTDILNAVQVKKAMTKMSNFIENVLGKGSLKTISEGRPIDTSQLLQIIIAIQKTAIDSYKEYVGENYTKQNKK